MTIKKAPKKQSRVTIDLRGPQGNAFFLIGSAKGYAKQLGKTNEETDAIIKDMQSSDYENLIEVFDQHFGEFVDLLR